ncbi:Putative subunit of the Anaphase Promoting Complex [Ectocarpus siliculosus]|uniref:Subunit of the Anaphase Promoting Complex n=1 Tax=Ectocarpus siliculosus TaxID=2880 RepID=D7FQK0_ECTSI|nr:Putative subunit of the Anaphase Promoting Complex [Ectocarpus siliculosus]|eukprot:CBJ30595.1 Putative subunit of the Anaphase Promoting Complex [Ectocarpus siliculosus]
MILRSTQCDCCSAAVAAAVGCVGFASHPATGVLVALAQEVMARVAQDDATVLFDIVEGLLREKLFHSAEIVGGILLSRASVSQHAGLHAEALSMFADALKGRGEHKRATAYCKQSLLHRQLQKEIASSPGSAFTSPPPPPRPASAEMGGSSQQQQQQQQQPPPQEQQPYTSWADRRRDRSGLRGGGVALAGDAGSGVDRTANLTPSQKEYLPVAELKFMEAQCLIAGGEPGTAIPALEAILQFARTAEMSATLGRVYESSGLKRNACSMYKKTLRENPMAVETIVPLLEMGSSGEEVLGIIDAALKGNPGGVTMADLPWLPLYVMGHADSCACRSKEALANFARLEHLYPNNLGALLQVAKAHMDLDQWDEALSAFKKARLVDDANVDLMDCYGVVMRQKTMPGGLNRLANELLSTDPMRAEAWVVMALYSEVRGDKDKATVFVDKALELKPNYAMAFILKGSLVLAEGNHEEAPKLFLQANHIRKDIYSYKGLVNAYLQAGKFRKAGFAAKEANEVMPGDARTVLLTGSVWEHIKGGMTDNRLKAKRAYEKALRIDPVFLDATLALVGLHMEDKEYDTCIDLLLKAVPHHTRDTLHTKLAEVYMLNGKLDDALESFHFAISLNPSCVKASQGLERLEKVMRGMDPDEDDDAMSSYGGRPPSPTY